MSKTIAYLTSRSNFVQVSEDVPITKQRNPEKYDLPDVFEGSFVVKDALSKLLIISLHSKPERTRHRPHNQGKTNWISDQLSTRTRAGRRTGSFTLILSSLRDLKPSQAKRLQTLEDEMTVANEEYIHAVNRASQSLLCFTPNKIVKLVSVTSRRSPFPDRGCSPHDACRHRRWRLSNVKAIWDNMLSMFYIGLRWHVAHSYATMLEFPTIPSDPQYTCCHLFPLGCRSWTCNVLFGYAIYTCRMDHVHWRRVLFLILQSTYTSVTCI